MKKRKKKHPPRVEGIHKVDLLLLLQTKKERKEK